MLLGPCHLWCHVILSLRKVWMMAGRRGILSLGAGTVLFHPSWRSPLSDEAGTTLVLASLLTVLIPWAPPCLALKWGVYYDSDSPFYTFAGVFSSETGQIFPLAGVSRAFKIRLMPLHVHLVPRAPFVQINSPYRCMLASAPSWDGHWFG